MSSLSQICLQQAKTFLYLSEHGCSLQSTQKSVEVDGQRLQGLIDGNKRWLEMRRKDTSMYPYVPHTLPHTRTHKKVQYPHKEHKIQHLIFNLFVIGTHLIIYLFSVFS